MSTLVVCERCGVPAPRRPHCENTQCTWLKCTNCPQLSEMTKEGQ